MKKFMTKSKLWTSMLSLLLIIPCMFIFSACGGADIKAFYDSSMDASAKTLNRIVTDKTDLSTNGDFTLTVINKEAGLSASDELEEESTTIQYSRKGTGANTIFEITKTVQSAGVTKITKDIYTSIVVDNTTKYYWLQEQKTGTADTVKTTKKTYTAVEDFISTVYSLGAYVFDEYLEDGTISSEIMIYSSIYKTEISGGGNNQSLKVSMEQPDINYDKTNVPSNINSIARTYSNVDICYSTYSMSFEIKDGYIYGFCEIEEYRDQEKTLLSSDESSFILEMTSSITAITSITPYLSA